MRPSDRRRSKEVVVGDNLCEDLATLLFGPLAAEEFAGGRPDFGHDPGSERVRKSTDVIHPSTEHDLYLEAGPVKGRHDLVSRVRRVGREHNHGLDPQQERGELVRTAMNRPWLTHIKAGFRSRSLLRSARDKPDPCSGETSPPGHDCGEGFIIWPAVAFYVSGGELTAAAKVTRPRALVSSTFPATKSFPAGRQRPARKPPYAFAALPAHP